MKLRDQLVDELANDMQRAPDRWKTARSVADVIISLSERVAALETMLAARGGK